MRHREISNSSNAAELRSEPAIFYQKPSCTSCRKAKSLLEKKGLVLKRRDLDKRPLSVGELDALIGAADYRQFLNTRNALYRERKMRERPPARAEALRLMSRNPNLIRRPITTRGRRMVLGFDAEALEKI
jgi:arsenate reductase (glutaredoxin)